MNSRFIVPLLVITLMCASLTSSLGQTYSFMHDNLLRSYIVHLPTNYNPANEYPLVINMHGLSNTATIQETYTNMNAISDTGNFIIIYPDATSSTSFNTGFNAPYNSGVDDVGFINALLDTAIVNYSIDTLRIYACGMSNGGFMSYRLACELEHRIAAIASVTGSMPDSMEYYCPYVRPIPVMQVHGTTDPTVNYNGAPGIWAIEATVDYWVQRNGCSTTPVTTAVPNTSLIDLCTAEKYYYGLCDSATEVQFFKITGGGHTWPGAVAVPVLGNTNQDFNAGGEIWKFFRKYTLPIQSNPVTLTENAKATSLKVWPNPSSGFVKINGLDGKNVDISITTILGQVVTLPNITQYETGQAELDISGLENGIYVLKVTQSSKVFSSTMMIIYNP